MFEKGYRTQHGKLLVEHIKFKFVNARIVWAGVNRRMLGIAHFRSNIMASVDFFDDFHDGRLFFCCCTPGDVADFFAVFRDDVESCGILWNVGVLFESKDGSRFKRFALVFCLIWFVHPIGVFKFLFPKVAVSDCFNAYKVRFARREADGCLRLNKECSERRGGKYCKSASS